VGGEWVFSLFIIALTIHVFRSSCCQMFTHEALPVKCQRIILCSVEVKFICSIID